MTMTQAPTPQSTTQDREHGEVSVPVKTGGRATEKLPGKGSFSVPKRAVVVLIHYNASSVEVCAYLIIAAFTDADGEYSTAGLKSIRERLSLEEPRAQAVVKRLVDMGLIYDLRPAPGEGSSKRRLVRFRLELYSEPRDLRAWFCMSLVEPGAAGVYPIKRLKQLTSRCALTFIWLHSEHEDRFMAVRPPRAPNVRGGAAFFYEHRPYQDGGNSWGNELTSYEVWTASDKQLMSTWVPEELDFESSLYSLMRSEMVYESIVVLDRPALAYEGEPGYCTDEDAGFLYTLWTPRNGAGTLMEVEKGLALRLKSIWERDEKDTIFGEGRFNGTYYVASPPGAEITVVGLLRLRYRVHNNRNLNVSNAWSCMAKQHQFFEKWMGDVERSFS